MARQTIGFSLHLFAMGRCFLLAALAGGLVACNSEPISTEPTRPANLALEERDGLFKPGATTPFTGTLARQHVNGAPSHEAGTNAFASCNVHGIPSSKATEYRFQDGYYCSARLEFQRPAPNLEKSRSACPRTVFARRKLFHQSTPDWHQAYVWFHIASANGHRNARQALCTPPENFSPEALSHARNEAMGLLGTNEVTTPDPPRRSLCEKGETEKD